MRIAIIGSNAFDSIEFHLNDELTVQGYESKIFNFNSLIPPKFDYGLSLISDKYVHFNNMNLLKRVMDFNPQLVICVYRNIHPDFVKTIKSNKIKIIHINPDALTTFQSQQLFVEPFDAYFSKDYFIVEFMKKKLGLNVFHYFEAFNPRIHRKPGIDKKLHEDKVDIDVLAFGNIYPYRARFLKKLENAGIKLSIHGRKSKFTESFELKNFSKKYIVGEEKVNLIYGSRIVLNNFHYAEIQSVNNKFFEINGIGGFQLCDYKDTLKDILPLDPQLVSFKSIVEAEELVLYYLSNPTKRWEIQSEIHSHFLNKYSYSSLLEYVFNKI